MENIGLCVYSIRKNAYTAGEKDFIFENGFWFRCSTIIHFPDFDISIIWIIFENGFKNTPSRELLG
ncbi:hypothetical protein V7O66_05460 [Methanolobus sp. ZRKC3]|uniref:hypothetical protein n=1 Tax=Methanolobus sp. ZRKC3 TaxID=3125786 RepID=UPI00324E6ABD